MKTRAWMFRSIAIVIALSLVSTACASPATSKTALTPIPVQLQWTHMVEFAGFYAVDQKGYYTSEGLAVTFVRGGVKVDNLVAMLDGKAQYGTDNAEQLIVAHAQGKLLRAFAVVYRRSPIVFFTLADSGITRPQDFIGKTIRESDPLANYRNQPVSLEWRVTESLFPNADIALYGVNCDR